MIRSAPRTALAAGAALLAALGLVSCAAAEPPGEVDRSALAVAGFPLTIDNCGSEVTLDAPPQRIVMVNNDELANLEALGAVDRIVAITSEPEASLYEPATMAAIGALDVLSTEKNATGGSVVSQESILGAAPDLVIAPERAVDRAALAAVGIPVFSPTAYCQDPPPAYTATATFDRVWDEVAALGAVLGEPDRAAEAIAAAKAELGAGAQDAGTAAALYVSSGGSVLSPYGGPSMVTPVFEAAGLTNVYADVDERVFDASIEDILSRDPGTIVILSSGGDPQTAIDAFRSAPGVAGLRAVVEDRVIALLFPYTDPPSVLSARGPAALRAALATLP